MRPDIGPYRDGRVHVLSERCTTCVFRAGNLMHLQPGRMKDLVETNRKRDTAFACHQTIYRKDVEPSVCQGYYDAFKDEITPLRLAEAMGVVEFDDPPKEKG